MKFHWMKIISLAAIAMVRGQNNEISFFDERERERGGGRRDCPTFVENICILKNMPTKLYPQTKCISLLLFYEFNWKLNFLRFLSILLVSIHCNAISIQLIW